MRLILIAAATLAMNVSAYGTETTVTYNVSPGSCSHGIAIPANLKPVIVSADNIQAGDEGAAQITILRQNKQSILIWTGTDSIHSSPIAHRWHCRSKSSTNAERGVAGRRASLQVARDVWPSL